MRARSCACTARRRSTASTPRALGSDRIDQSGPNAGYYPRATAAEICDYYQRVLDEQLLPSGRVRFFGMSDCLRAGQDGYVEASRDDDAQKNRLCPANPYPNTAMDWIPVTRIAQRAEIAWVADPDVSSWMQRSRLNATQALSDHLDDPLMKSALTRLFVNIEPAIAKLGVFMGKSNDARS